MYLKAYGIIETLAPLHLGAAAGEESGNLNLIFRDQFTQTGIIPSSSLRGRLRSDMLARLTSQYKKRGQSPEQAKTSALQEVERWYGRGAEKNRQENYDYESIIKPEHASIVWLPVFCPGQPIVWVSCPSLLRRYQRIADVKADIPPEYTGSQTLKTRSKNNSDPVLFFNLGFITVSYPNRDLTPWFPLKNLPAVVVDDNDMGMIHDMALYRQSRVQLEEDRKVAANKAFFNVEVIPEGTVLAFPLALKPIDDNVWDNWKPLEQDKTGDIYLGGLESVGFGHCMMTLKKPSGGAS
ncbi:RAMP superfamily CRISPR-associated protein [Microcystis aeruginosa]|uniref:RAMP superfamily CRISPR-associated protein n=1 Tax=Microcystis aeruginosa TaxID=1126 RepID=UPI00292F3481|nr:RAMP superfamily CRISPR-associated protein [Microcystis aeruginosa]WOB68443.1 RAMP superfamily CRISPR-associated protein [Microcystis aeruginosa LE3]